MSKHIFGQMVAIVFTQAILKIAEYLLDIPQF